MRLPYPRDVAEVTITRSLLLFTLLLLGFGLVLGLEAGEGFGGVVKGVINAFAAEEQTITRFHVHASSILPWG